MSIIYAFLFSGLICLIAEFILSNTKLTPGHITSLISVLGALLSFFNVYEIFIKKCNMGALILISNFGNSLYKAGLEGYYKNGFLGILSNMFSKSSLVITSTIIFSFIFVIIFKPKD